MKKYYYLFSFFFFLLCISSLQATELSENEKDTLREKLEGWDEHSVLQLRHILEEYKKNDPSYKKSDKEAARKNNLEEFIEYLSHSELCDFIVKFDSLPATEKENIISRLSKTFEHHKLFLSLTCTIRSKEGSTRDYYDHLHSPKNWEEGSHDGVYRISTAIDFLSKLINILLGCGLAYLSHEALIDDTGIILEDSVTSFCSSILDINDADNYTIPISGRGDLLQDTPNGNNQWGNIFYMLLSSFTPAMINNFIKPIIMMSVFMVVTHFNDKNLSKKESVISDVLNLLDNLNDFFDVQNIIKIIIGSKEIELFLKTISKSTENRRILAILMKLDPEDSLSKIHIYDIYNQITSSLEKNNIPRIITESSSHGILKFMRIDRASNDPGLLNTFTHVVAYKDFNYLGGFIDNFLDIGLRIGYCMIVTFYMGNILINLNTKAIVNTNDIDTLIRQCERLDPDNPALLVTGTIKQISMSSFSSSVVALLGVINSTVFPNILRRVICAIRVFFAKKLHPRKVKIEHDYYCNFFNAFSSDEKKVRQKKRIKKTYKEKPTRYSMITDEEMKRKLMKKFNIKKIDKKTYGAKSTTTQGQRIKEATYTVEHEKKANRVHRQKIRSRQKVRSEQKKYSDLN